jgi:hypothetical protein
MGKWIRKYRATIRRRRLLRELHTLVTLGDCAAGRRRALARELQIETTPSGRGVHFFFVSGCADALRPETSDRRWVALDIDEGR